MAIKGSTADERRQQRVKRTAKRRVAFYAGRIRAARNGREQISHACDYAKAVGDDLTDAERRIMARSITELADERNKP